MNHTYRFLLGLLSCMLLSVGLVTAADHVDPIAKSRSFAADDAPSQPAPDCGTATCWIDDTTL